MLHVTDSQVIRHISGELPPSEQAALETHVAECAECRARLEVQRALSTALGAWEAPSRRADLTAAVLGRLDTVPGALPRRISVARAMRVAAAVVLGIGLGHAAGRWVHQLEASQPSPSGALVAVPPSYPLLSEPDVVGLWIAYDELADQDEEDAS